MTHTLISLNTKGTTPGLPMRAVADDLRRVRKAGVSILLLQEVMPLRYWAAIKAVFPPRRWGRYPARYGARGMAHLILWDRKSWRAVAADVAPLHDSKPGVTQNRYLVAVLLENNHTGLRLWVRNTHYVAGAWNRKQTPDDVERRALWNLGNTRDRRELRLKSADGYPVISGGDYNRMGHRVLGGRLEREDVRYVGPLGVDYIAVADGATARIIVRRDYVIPDSFLNTDHAARVVAFDMRRRGIR